LKGLAPPKPPNAQEGPDAVMQAIDEWLEYKERLDLLKAITHRNKAPNNARPESTTRLPTIMESHKELYEAADWHTIKKSTFTATMTQETTGQDLE